MMAQDAFTNYVRTVVHSYAFVSDSAFGYPSACSAFSIWESEQVRSVNDVPHFEPRNGEYGNRRKSR
jgi:hypothetical protein